MFSRLSGEDEAVGGEEVGEGEGKDAGDGERTHLAGAGGDQDEAVEKRYREMSLRGLHESL